MTNDQLQFNEEQRERAEAYDNALAENPELQQGIEELTTALSAGQLCLAQIGGFGETELEGGYKAAVSLLESDMAAKGLKVVGTLLTLNPTIAKYYRLAGIALHRLKYYELADGYYDIALAIDPDDPIAKLYRGECHLFMEKRASGRKLLEEGIAQAEGSPELHSIVQRARAIAQALGVPLNGQ